MANKQCIVPLISSASLVASSAHVSYYIADTDAGKPSSGLNVGDLCYAVDTGAKFTASSATTWREDSAFMYSQTTETGSIAGSENEDTMVGTGKGSKSIPASFFSDGRILRVTAGGRMLITQLGAMTLQVRAKKGTTVIADTGAVLFASTTGDVHWTMEANFLGVSSTSVITHARFLYKPTTTQLAAPNMLDMKFAYAATTISSSAEDFDLTAKWSGVSAASYIYARLLLMERIAAT